MQPHPSLKPLQKKHKSILHDIYTQVHGLVSFFLQRVAPTILDTGRSLVPMPVNIDDIQSITQNSSYIAPSIRTSAERTLRRHVMFPIHGYEDITPSLNIHIYSDIKTPLYKLVYIQLMVHLILMIVCL